MEQQSVIVARDGQFGKIVAVLGRILVELDLDGPHVGCYVENRLLGQLGELGGGLVGLGLGGCRLFGGGEGIEAGLLGGCFRCGFPGGTVAPCEGEECQAEIQNLLHAFLIFCKIN